MSGLRRYEILLPSRYNDGQPISETLLAQTILELRQQFGAVSCETKMFHGEWESEGVIYRDELARVFVDVPDIPANREFFVEFKKRLKDRFQQLDIWLTTYSIEVI